MSSYALQGSYSTVQVLSPSLVNDVVYCTISTLPSGVIASIPVQNTTFKQDGGGVELTNFADAIEQIMQNPAVVAGVGGQQIEPSGLLADYVVFTVQYPPEPTSKPTATADADVPVGLLNFTDAEIGRVALDQVDAIINGVYDNLKNLAGD